MPQQRERHNYRHVGIVIPTSFELGPLLLRLPQLTLQQSAPWQIYQGNQGNLKISLIVSFIGPANAAAATEYLIGLGPELVLHGGAAGAIDSALMPGDIVFGAACKIICSPEVLAVRKTLLIATTNIRYLKDGQPVHLDKLPGDPELLKLALEAAPSLVASCPPWAGPGWPQENLPPGPINVVAGMIGSTDGWTKGLEQLKFVRENFQVSAEDMESAYIAQTCAIHELPDLAVRAISNNEYKQTLAKEEIIPAVKAAAANVAAAIQAIINLLAN